MPDRNGKRGAGEHRRRMVKLANLAPCLCSNAKESPAYDRYIISHKLQMNDHLIYKNGD